MAHLFLQEDPKVSVGDANDVASTIPTPEQLGSLLLTYDATGATGQTAAMYAALAIGGTAQWVPIAGAAPPGNTNGYLYNGGAQFNSGLAVVAAADFTIGGGSSIHITRRSDDASAVGIPSIVSVVLGGPGVATFTVRAEDPATGAAVAADGGFFNYTIIG